MYSGLTISRFSGRVMGTHQKLDRVARLHLKKLLGVDNYFPPVRQILHFEGVNGPDAIHRKSPARDDPMYFFNPLDPKDKALINIINNHYKQLVLAINSGNREQAAFQAAWLAHALVDGLTPAHHYPYVKTLSGLRNGEHHNTRLNILGKLIMKGDTASKKLANNWRAWGPNGLFMAHGLFELGVAAIVRPLRLPDAKPSKADIKEMNELGLEEYFVRRAREVIMLDMFEDYIKKGWTGKLARTIRQQLAPTMVKTVTLAWYQACQDSKRGL